MLRLGLRATINSDDPAYFGGYVNDNFRAVGALLDRADLITLARNSFLGSFLNDVEIAGHLVAVEAYALRYPVLDLETSAAREQNRE